MKIEIRLKKVLHDFNLDDRGVTQRIARDLKVHRHTIGKLYRNQLTHPSLDVIEKLCDWLIRNGVTAQLPEALFGARPAELWKALTRQKRMTFYLGEYEDYVETGTGPARRWLALRDVEAWAHTIYTITTERNLDPGTVQFAPAYVRFRFDPKGTVDPEVFHKYRMLAVKQYRQMIEAQSASILIGSQRVNYLLELLVADLFGIPPFKGVRQRPKVPFFLFYPHPMHESCFGGFEQVPGLRGDAEPGTYWRNDKDRWDSFKWVPLSQDAGLVITIYHPGTEVVHLALFGYSGRATAVLAKKVCTDPEAFWPPTAEIGSRHVGVYVCKFTVDGPLPNVPGASADLKHNTCEVIPLDDGLLRRYLRA